MQRQLNDERVNITVERSAKAFGNLCQNQKEQYRTVNFFKLGPTISDIVHWKRVRVWCTIMLIAERYIVRAMCGEICIVLRD